MLGDRAMGLGGWGVRIEGSVSRGYEAVVDALAECGAGVAVAAFVGGRLVVDAWSADLSGESLVCTWSAIKPITGACLLLLVERGLIALDDPVVSVWPELGDGRLLVRHLLTHTAGRVTVPDVALVDWNRSVAALRGWSRTGRRGMWSASTPRLSVIWSARSFVASTAGPSDRFWAPSTLDPSASTSTSVSMTSTWPESLRLWGWIARGGRRHAASRDRCVIGRWGRGST